MGTKDKKSDNVENSGNLVEQETYALENAISLDPFTDYEKLYKDQEDSFANPPTTSQPFADEEIDRFPQTKNPNTFQQQSSLNNFKNKEQTSDGKPNYIFGVIDHQEVIEGREALSVTDRVHTEDHNTDLDTEQYYTTSVKPAEETTEPREEKEEVEMMMCANIEDKQEMIRCKLIACWKDNQYCF